jgi:hypothetical protein
VGSCRRRVRVGVGVVGAYSWVLVGRSLCWRWSGGVVWASRSGLCRMGVLGELASSRGGRVWWWLAYVGVGVGVWSGLVLGCSWELG